MQKRIFFWLDRECIELSAAARPTASVEEETNSLFRSFEQELKADGLSLENTVRTRLWGRDREARNLGTAARSKILTAALKLQVPVTCHRDVLIQTQKWPLTCSL